VSRLPPETGSGVFSSIRHILGRVCRSGIGDGRPWIGNLLAGLPPKLLHSRFLSSDSNARSLSFSNESNSKLLSSALNWPLSPFMKTLFNTFGGEIVDSLKEIGDMYSLFRVGKGGRGQSSLTIGMSDWEECRTVGDVLASSDFDIHGSVLIVQQHRDAKKGILHD